MAKRIRLTAKEISAVIGAAGDIDIEAHFQCLDDPEAEEAAYESGLEKLRAMLARLKGE